MNDVIFQANSSKTLQQLRQDLEKELTTCGFGVLTEINVPEVMKKKGVDFDRDILILGICNPNYAKKAITSNEDVAVMLPCTAAVYGTPDGSYVKLGRPSYLVNLFPGDTLKELGSEVDGILIEAIEAACA